MNTDLDLRKFLVILHQLLEDTTFSILLLLYYLFFPVLPKFEVSIIPPPFFRQNCEDIEVRAMYVFGKPVLGRLEVNMSVHGVDYSRTHFMDISSPIFRQMRVSIKVYKTDKSFETFIIISN